MLKTNVRLILAAIALFFGSHNMAFAQGIDTSKFEYEVGLGIQYAGFIGAKANYVLEEGKQNVYGAVGLPGFGVGYDYAISENISIGAAGSLIFPLAFISANVSYYQNSVFNEGFRIGLDVFNASFGSLGGISGFGVGFTIGYRFD